MSNTLKFESLFIYNSLSLCLVLAAIFFIQLFFIAWDCQFISFHIYTQFFNSLLFYSGLFNVLMVSLFFSSFCLVNQRFSVLKMCSVTRTHSCCVLMSVLLTSSSNVDCMFGLLLVSRVGLRIKIRGFLFRTSSI